MFLKRGKEYSTADVFRPKIHQSEVAVQQKIRSHFVVVVGIIFPPIARAIYSQRRWAVGLSNQVYHVVPTVISHQQKHQQQERSSVVVVLPCTVLGECDYRSCSTDSAHP